ncbi:MAG: DUF2442 domain-containing protein [Gemmatimonadales bacterium]
MSEPIPKVVDASYRGGYRIRLTFRDGTAGTVDFQPYLGMGPVFAPLKAKDYFARFLIDGDTVSWPNGADIAPETLYAEAQRTAKRGRTGRG